MLKAPFAFMFIFLLQPNACNKKNTATNTTIKSINDCGEDPAKLLVKKSWYVYELTFVSRDEILYFKLGGSKNTWDFTDDQITFKEDGTGFYTNRIESFKIKWEFIDDEKKKIRYTIFDYDMGSSEKGVNLVVNWENVVVTRDYLRYAEIYTNSDSRSVISSGTRINL